MPLWHIACQLRRLLIASLLLALASQPAAGGSGLASPGEVLFVREVRLAWLQQQDPAERERLCGARVRKWPSVKARTTVRPVEGSGDETTELFAWMVMRAAADAFGTGDRTAEEALVGQLRRWANGRALTKFKREDAASWYVVERTLLPTIVAWALVGRDNPRVTTATARLVEDWLAGLVARIREHRFRLRSDDISARNNHAYLAATVLMAWGGLTGDRSLVDAAVAVYQHAIADMRPDGSFPLETARGARALWYQRHAVASLVTLAQMAEVQGIDLWGYRVGSRDIHRAVRFLLEGIENPRLVWQYAQENFNPGPSENWMVQDLGFMRRRGHGRHYMAWAEIYMARFPEREEAKHLAAALADFDPESRPMIDEYSGGNTTCYFAVPGRRTSGVVSANSTRSPDSVPSALDMAPQRTWARE